jgi:hypothetical protein
VVVEVVQQILQEEAVLVVIVHQVMGQVHYEELLYLHYVQTLLITLQLVVVELGVLLEKILGLVDQIQFLMYVV